MAAELELEGTLKKITDGGIRSSYNELMSTGLEVQEELAVSVNTDNGDHDLFAHYVDKDEIADAVINGWPVIALCGKIWVPSRDPDRYPICPTCEEIYAEMFGS